MSVTGAMYDDPRQGLHNRRGGGVQFRRMCACVSGSLCQVPPQNLRASLGVLRVLCRDVLPDVLHGACAIKAKLREVRHPVSFSRVKNLIRDIGSGIRLQRVEVRRGVAKVGHKWAISAMLVPIAYRFGALQMRIVSQRREQAKWGVQRLPSSKPKEIPMYITASAEVLCPAQGS